MAYWAKCKGGDIPQGALQGGYESDGKPLYIAKAFNRESNTWVPGKAGGHLRNGCHYSYGCKERAAMSYEILIYDPSTYKMLEWQQCSGGQIPNRQNTFCVSESEGAYVGRVFHDGAMTPGKVDTRHGCLYIPYGNKELNFKTYEVLCIRD